MSDVSNNHPTTSTQSIVATTSYVQPLNVQQTLFQN